MILSVSHLSLSYGHRTIFKDLSFSVPEKSIVALIGSNGIGKTSLLKLISGVLNSTSQTYFVGGGRVIFAGEDFLSLSPGLQASRVVYLPQEIKSEFPLTVKEVVGLGGIPNGEHPNQVQEKVDLALKKCFCDHLSETNFQTLSGGEKQLVSFARALVQNPKLFLLDEAFSLLDLNHQEKMGYLIRELSNEGYSFIWVAHDLNFILEWANKALMFISHNRMLSGDLPEIVTDENLKTIYPQAFFTVGKNPMTGAPKIFLKLKENRGA